ncbi:unnamed protein product [Moneuplotes crassus]|uniref:Serine aminopeptidase S33 domain-containing protein n=1 Tax=Euplotes crassus TaxID=5936 RepID=A0AAD1XUJ1_EUPCR|nr:unnamed protein product [Moneuplotes crassus]
MNNKIWILSGLGACLIVLLILYLLYAIFTTLAFFITGFGACMLYIWAMIYLVRYVIRSMVFPGSNFLVQKTIEYNIRESITRLILRKVGNLKYTLEETSLNDELNEDNVAELKNSISDFKKMAEVIVNNCERQKDLQIISADQKAFQLKLEELKRNISSIHLLKPNESMTTISIWEVGSHSVEELIGCAYSDNLRFKISTLDLFTDNLSTIMGIETDPGCAQESKIDFSTIKRWLQSLHIYLSNKSYGHLDYTRTHLEVSGQSSDPPSSCSDEQMSHNQCYIVLSLNSCKCNHQEFVTTSDGARLDTMWVENKLNEGNRHAPAVMICNPNCVYYENFGIYEDQFFNFFLRNGFNVFLWNYRGYGRSTGSISPDSFFEDADHLVQYLVNIRGVTRLLVHGSSLGGAIACHLANNPNVEAVFADRTFSSLDSVIRDDFGPTLRFLYNLFTVGQWKMKVSQKYLMSDKYKILSADPQDSLIPDLSSLKNGVARASLRYDLGKSSRAKPGSFFDVCTIINKEETDAIFGVLKEIFMLNFTKIKEEHSKIVKAHEDNDEEKMSIVELDYVCDEDSAGGSHLAVPGGVGSVMNPQLCIAKSQERIGLDGTDKVEVLEIFEKEYAEVVKNEMEIFNKSKQKCGYGSLQKWALENYSQCEIIELWLRQVKKILCRQDSSGLTFYNIFQRKENIQYKMFKQFLINLEIWGSYTGLPVSNQGFYDVKSAKRMSELQLHDMLEGLHALIRSLKSENLAVSQLLADKIGALGYFFTKISKHLGSELEKERTKFFDRRDDEDIFENEILEIKRNTKTTAEDEESVSFLDISKTGEDSIGMLIPLKCGHNGSYSNAEMSIYKSHLKQIFEHLRDT